MNIMTEENDSKGHDMDEADVSERYRGASTEQPAEALDARILAAAREAVATPDVARPAWRPFAVAAVVLLSATLVITMRPPDDEVMAPETAATMDAAESPPAPAMPDSSVAPARRAASGTALEEIVVTGNRVAADDDAATATVAGKAVAQFAERERRMPGAEADATPADGADAAIDAIVAAWDAGDKTEAERLLDLFADTYPGYPKADLGDALPAELLERWSRE